MKQPPMAVSARIVLVKLHLRFVEIADTSFLVNSRRPFSEGVYGAVFTPFGFPLLSSCGCISLIVEPALLKYTIPSFALTP